MSSVETAQVEAGGLPTWRTRPHRSQPAFRAPWRRGSWSPEEVARALKARREEFCRALERRRDAAGVPAGMHEEIVDEAICAVVMSRRAVVSEEHLLGAFWRAVGLVLKEHRAGRRVLRVGSRERVDFELTAARIPTSDEPFDVIELREQMARAADFMAALSAFEQKVVVVMAVNGGGVKFAARMLGEPIKTVRAAVRSADEKLDQVAVIAAAGRMCSYRYSAIVAEASGFASEDQAQAARAHVAACVSCRRWYAGLCREMRGREFRRAAVAAFLPMPAEPLAHAEGLGKLAAWIEHRLGFPPHGSGERAAEVLGGAGVAKAAVAGTAIVAATASIATHTLQAKAPMHHRNHRHHAIAATGVPAAITTPAANQDASVSAAGVSSTPGPAASSAHHEQQPASTRRLPRRLQYLAVGGSAPPQRSHAAVAATASVNASRQAPSAVPSASTATPTPSTEHTASVHSSTDQRFAYLGHQ